MNLHGSILVGDNPPLDANFNVPNLPNQYFWLIIVLPSLAECILSDYVSLFIIRRFLTFKVQSAVVTFVLVVSVGLFFVFIFIFVRAAIVETSGLTSWFLEHLTSTPPPPPDGLIGKLAYSHPIIPVAIAVIINLSQHLWILLVLVAVIVIRSAKFVPGAVSFMQWFFDKGDEHPLKAIGFVSAAVVFITTTAITIVRHFEL